jgi:two-component system sensor histidine kinase ChvG
VSALRRTDGVGDPLSPRSRRRHDRFLSPLTLRILALNGVSLVILAVGLLFLGRYQDGLVRAELAALTDQARVFAAALGEGAVMPVDDERHALEPEAARAMIRRLTATASVRTRLFAPDGALLADSRALFGPGGPVQIVQLPPADRPDLARRLVYAVYDWIVVRVPDWEDLPPYVERPEQRGGDYPDVVGALAGGASAHAWSGPDQQLVLTAAVPVQRLRQIQGVVMVSRPGADIAAAVRSVRLEVLQVFAGALLVTTLLSLWLAQTIARPIRRLARAADRVRPGHGATSGRRRAEIPDYRHRRDEIGDLSGAVRDMTAALWDRLDAIERFAADVAHELKNPLASLRSAVETAGRIQDPERRARLMAVIEHDVRRLDRLISDISAASRLDAELSRAEPQPVDVARMLATLAEIHAATAEDEPEALRVAMRAWEGPPLMVPGLEGRLVQVFQNLIANALSFSPPGGEVRLSVQRVAGPDGERAVVRVEDDGPGIPPGKEEAIFERFYTERPAGEGFGQHSGLGLSIARQIVEALGGRLTAGNRTDAEGRPLGAVFTVSMPVG